MKIKVGNKYNKLTVLLNSLKKQGTHIMWLCLCDCGNENLVRSDKLISGKIKKCDCLKGKHTQLERERAYAKDYYHRKRQDPNWLEKENERKRKSWKNRYHKIKRSISYKQKQKRPLVKLNGNIRRSISRSLKNGKGYVSKNEMLDFNLNQLKKHLEKQFTKGMTWDNYGEWHVDHIIPLSAFNYKKPTDIDFKKAWALSNLQPLWSNDNLLKANKIDKPFQPSFAF